MIEVLCTVPLDDQATEDILSAMKVLGNAANVRIVVHIRRKRFLVTFWKEQA
jgi:hypothetical protein